MSTLLLAATPPATTEKTNNFLIPNGTFFFELICFAIILYILAKYAVPKLSAILQARQDLIAKQFEESAEAKDRLEKAESEYKAALAEAKKEGARIREDAAAERARIVEEARAQAQVQVEEMLARAEARIATEREQTIRALHGEVGTLAVTLAERVIGVALRTDKAQTAVVDEFLAGLEAQSAAAESTV
jgi:F-type H+-transporting ATPase subunit b